MNWRILTVVSLIICGAIASRAGGPAFVAGSGYAAGVEGQALGWANASVQYFTDQGNLSPILPAAQADALVASAFAAWTATSNSTTLTATQAGHLAEDVNGANIAVAANGVITAPADITSSATRTPVGIVYDYDGTVTDALLGQGAGGLADCFSNGVFGGPDNFSTSGNIVHAFVVINGVCAATSTQLPDVQYRLVRVLGRIIGLGWSQANLNVQTLKPPPTSADFAGFPVMHYTDSISCVPISICYPTAAVPKMDDIAALARLYPPANEQSSGRVYGSVYFTDSAGNALQQMQGVNVVARLMVAGQPSRQYVVSSVSGFSFCGNAGNVIDGYVDANGLRYDRWGSDDPSLEGFFDLGQLVIPTGQTIAQYQLSVESLDSYWSFGVEPYAPTQVALSGIFAPVVVTVANGSNAERDILLLKSEIAQAHPGSGSTYATPVAIPPGGAWGSWISGYGSSDWFEFTAQANRTASVSVMALDEAGQPTEIKLWPVIGIWQLSDESGSPAPAATPSAFNTRTWGLTRLDAQFGATDTYRVGIADFRGDGRPDYFYQASVLYSDTVTPGRLGLAGGVATLNGIGFNSDLQVTVGGNQAATLAMSAGQMEVAIPGAVQDGIATIQVTNPISGAFSQMIGALSYGAQPTDLLLLLQGGEPSTPVGSIGANAIRVRAVAADGITPVNGATIAWSATNGLQFSVCGGTSSCSVLSDEAGESSSLVTPTATGSSTITIALAPASYSPPQSQQATVVATSSQLDLVAETPTRWVGQGATIAVPLTVETLNLGAPKANVAVKFSVSKGTASLSAASATTNASGVATITAQLTNQNADVQVSACVSPNGSPCQTFTLFSTAASAWRLETANGSSQVVATGQTFQRLVMRVTDGSVADNPVLGVNVIFETTLTRVSPEGGSSGLPVTLGSSQTPVVTTQDGLASVVPSPGNVGPCDVFVEVTAGASSMQFQMQNLAAIIPIVPGPRETGSRSSLIAINWLPLGSPSAPPPAMLPLLAVPQAISGNDPAPDSPLVPSTEPAADEASIDHVDSTASDLQKPALDEKPIPASTKPTSDEASPPNKTPPIENPVPQKATDAETAQSPVSNQRN